MTPSRRRAAARLLVLALLATPNGVAAQNFFEDLFGGMEGRPLGERRAPPHRREERRRPEKPPVERAPAERPRSERPSAPAEPKAARRREEPQRPNGPKPETKSAAPAPTGQEPPPPPYDAQVQRLAELLGGLSYLRDLCGDGDGADWRAKMIKLRDADAPSGPRRARLTAAFNRGFEGYELTYRNCTPNAHLVIARYLEEAQQVSNSIVTRYGAP
jgi:uncharacterized protein (TIGR02301 family)